MSRAADCRPNDVLRRGGNLPLVRISEFVHIVPMKAIRKSFKTMFFAFSSVMISLVGGCGIKQADPVEFKSEVIKEVQGRISRDMPLVINGIEITRDVSKSTKGHLFGNFAAVAIASESLYGLVPATDLRAFGINYITDSEIKSVTSTLTDKLAEIGNSVNGLPETSAHYDGATNKIIEARLLLENVRKLELLTFVTLGVAKGAELSVRGTVGAILTDAKKWAPDKIEITGIESSGMVLTGRNLFVESQKMNSDLLIVKGETNMAAANEITRHLKIFADAQNAVVEAEKAVGDALAAEIAKGEQSDPESEEGSAGANAYCEKCGGRGTAACSQTACVNGKNTGVAICPTCRNTKSRDKCEVCNKTGYVPLCPVSICDGKGKIKCADCDGSGKSSHRTLEW